MRRTRPVIDDGPYGNYVDPWDNLSPEDQKIADAFGELQERIRQKEEEQNEKDEAEQLNRHVKKTVDRLKMLFKDPEFRAMAKELFQEAKAVRDDVQIDDRQSISR